MRRRWLLVGGAMAVLSMGLAWRAIDDDGRDAHAGEVVWLDGVIPARAGVTLPPGTAIGAGLEVASGSYLLAGPLPYLYSELHGGDPTEDDGFTAHLLVTEPIDGVVNKYSDQASDAGFEMGPIDCRIPYGLVVCATSCDSSCGLRSSGFEHGRTLSIEGEQGPSRRGAPPVSHLVIDYRRIGEPPFPSDEPPPEHPDRPAPSSVPSEWPSLPEVGDPIYSFNSFEVAPGTILLAHGLARSSMGATAVFEVVDDIDEVVDRFLAQPEHRGDEPDRTTYRRNGHRVERVSWSDGHSQTLMFYEPPEGPTILVLSSYLTD